MRDNLIHRYFKVNYDVVWTTIKNEVPLLNFEVQKMLGQIYRESYLFYQQQIDSKTNTESIEREIANLILQEYLPKFKTIAVAKIERILSQSDYALQLKSQNNSIESYLNSIIESLKTTEEI